MVPSLNIKRVFLNFPLANQNRRFIEMMHETTTVDTLDEPVTVTLKRDLLNIWNKIKQVLNPATKQSDILRDWDWWGPLLFCLALSVRLSLGSYLQGPEIFSMVFFIIWCGSGVVTLNSLLLGNKISFYQSVCVLGYCIFPLVAVSMVTLVVGFGLKLILSGVALAWATASSINFLGKVQEKRKALTVYPIFLFYFMLTWLILVLQ